MCASLHACAQADALPEAPRPVMVAASGAPPLIADSTSLVGERSGDAQRTDQRTDEHGGSPQTSILPQQKRVFGVMSNYTSVSGGTRPRPAGWRTDAGIAWRQSTDYSAIGWSLATSAIAYGEDDHPLLSTVNGGNAVFWAYTWRGLLDRTDQAVQSTLLFPALLHQDTRYYAMGTGPVRRRTLHAVYSVVVAHSYSGNPVFNVAGLAGKVGTQAVSTTYYPSGSEGFGVLASKFAYSCLRQAGFTVLREFSPDLSQRLHLHVKGSN